MTTKLVLRLMDPNGEMLGSTVHYADIKGDGCLRAAGLVTCNVSREGRIDHISIHWCDINVETRGEVASGRTAVFPGNSVTMYQPNEPIVKVGSMPGPLPPITVGASEVGIPVGVLGASGSR